MLRSRRPPPSTDSRTLSTGPCCLSRQSDYTPLLSATACTTYHEADSRPRGATERSDSRAPLLSLWDVPLRWSSCFFVHDINTKCRRWVQPKQPGVPQALICAVCHIPVTYLSRNTGLPRRAVPLLTQQGSCLHGTDTCLLTKARLLGFMDSVRLGGLMTDIWLCGGQHIDFNFI